MRCLPVLLAGLFLFLFPARLRAQVLSAQIVDAGTSEPLKSGTIQNLRTGAVAAPDSEGYFQINAAKGEPLRLFSERYKAVQIVFDGRSTLQVFQLFRDEQQLAEVEVTTAMSRFKKDSIANRQLFKKTLEDAALKPRVSVFSSAPLQVDGLFSELALRASGKKKKDKAFVAQLQQDEALRYTEIRYTIPLVQHLTGLDSSAANTFMVKHPIAYEELRQLSDLELKIRIRDAFHQDYPGRKPPLLNDTTGAMISTRQ